MRPIQADYLVVGAGAMGMAFVDALIAESDASVVIVDRNHAPGGHWTTAYPFVRLHQPSAYYGVNSRHLGSGAIDRSGPNAGFYELAGGAEVCAYYEAVMREQLQPTGRVTYLPMAEHLGGGLIRTLGGEDLEVVARRTVVSHLDVVVPSMRPPAYDVAGGVECVAPNALPRVRDLRDRYVIVGAGKTAMDACVFLLRHGVPPQRLTWIKPREAWLMDRATVQPGAQFAKRALADFTAQLVAVRDATSFADLFARLEAKGCLLRIDASVDPTMYRCAIVSQGELELLRRIDGVVRLGHVTAIEPGRVTLDGGTVDVDGSVLYVDCTADGLGDKAPAPIFDGERITLQTVRTCQPAFSASVIGHVEAAYGDDETRNAFCGPVPYPHLPADWLRMMLAFNRNQLHWFTDPDMMAWVDGARLNILHHITAGVSERAREKIVSMLGSQLHEINGKLEALLAEA
ncbi:NAD(P)-binding protein [Mycolicibacterium baixiangningiae]|uniref:NAD(P)-binding protein n=1 Tax=Mycolicibacterium baixiangningiae TaxID=2761578 RepID=UPI001865D6D8|nr:NAD(P)-binding protein [Mycolicibacterium baixiangningiae]